MILSIGQRTITSYCPLGDLNAIGRKWGHDIIASRPLHTDHERLTLLANDNVICARTSVHRPSSTHSQTVPIMYISHAEYSGQSPDCPLVTSPPLPSMLLHLAKRLGYISLCCTTVLADRLISILAIVAQALVLLILLTLTLLFLVHRAQTPPFDLELGNTTSWV